MEIQSEALRSINDRLKALLVVMGGDIGAGRDIPALGTRYLQDLHWLEKRRVDIHEKHSDDSGDT